MFNVAMFYIINLMFCVCLVYTYKNENVDGLENVFQFGVNINNLEPKRSLSIPDAEDPIETAESLDSNAEFDNFDGRRRRKSKHGKEALRIRNPFNIPSKIKVKKANATDTTNYPYMAAIIIYGRLWCAGAIVDDNWIVTAAHCLNYVLNLSPLKTLKQFVKVRVGSKQAHEGGQVVDVVGAIRHPKFEEEPVPHADVALLKLAEHLKFSPTVNLIKIYNGIKEPFAQSFIVVSGWGASGSGIAAFNEHSQELLSARLKVRSQHYCIDAYQLVNGFQFSEDFFCASLRNGTRDACLFDAGAPAVQENSLMGIMSFGPEKCGHEYQPAVFIKAFYFRDFVRQTIISYKTTGELIDAMHQVDPIIMRPLQVVTLSVRKTLQKVFIGQHNLSSNVYNLNSQHVSYVFNVSIYSTMDIERKCSASKQILTALLATIPTFTYGIQIGWLSPMGPLLQKPSENWDPLTFMDISWMATALPLAAICGIPFFSIASDRFGRKICIIFVSLLSSISWIIKLMAFKSYVFILARVFAGLAAGGCFVVVPVYIKEISEDSWRGALTSLTMTVCKLGVIFVYVIGMLLSYKANQWIYLSIAGLHVILFCFMPESPNYLLKRGSEKKAAKTIAWLRNLKRNDKIVLDEISKLKEERRKFEEMPKISLIGIFRDRATFSALRMTLMLMAMQTLSGCFLLMNYASNVFSRADTKWSPNALAILMGSLQLAGSFFTTMSIEKFGRKIPLACSSLVVSICMATVATCFLLELNGNLLPVIAVCVCILAYGAGLAPVPMVVMAEVFTFELRARMAGASMAFSFFCSSMTVLLYAPITNAFGPHVIFYVFSAVCLLGVVYTVLWVPETRGKTLKQIQEFWQKEPLPTFV